MLLENVNIRLTTNNDLSVLNHIDHVARDDSERRSFIQDATNDSRAWTIEETGEIVGYGVVSHNFFGRSFIELIYIDEQRRSNGLGPTLISFLEGQSRSSDLFTSTNESNLHMQRVLEKLNYVRSGFINNLDLDDPELIYVKKIGAN